ncbi:MAG TPA: hypothetical protein VN026_17375 [Bacteroidia bacterium]|jgi:hypothetical protein|nr:hypothetical protein [Bacteroidia bacterium]
MDPEKEKKNSDKSQAGSENNANEMNAGNDSNNLKSSEMQEPEKKIKPDWDDRQIDFDQLIF